MSDAVSLGCITSSAQRSGSILARLFCLKSLYGHRTMS